MIYFILGILFYLFVIPILESLVELIQVAIEKVKGKFALDIAKMNKEVADLTNPKEEHRAIGFLAPSYEEDLDEDED